MEELGYSPIIQRCCDMNNQLCLVFKVRDRYFKTLSCVSEHRNIIIAGRATRVYQAQEVTSFDDLTGLGEPVILKYAWIGEGELTESSIQNKIYAELDGLAEQLGNKDAEKPPHFLRLNTKLQSIVFEKLQSQEYKKHFATIICDAQGMTCKPIASNFKPSGDLFVNRSTEVVPPTLQFGDSLRSMHDPRDERPATSNGTEHRLREFVPKRQHFTVFREIGIALHNVPKFKDVLQAMMDSYIGEPSLGVISRTNVERNVFSGGSTIPCWLDSS
jgi:hypothetical protein